MSSTDLIRAYFAERYRPAFFVPVAALLFATGAAALGTPLTPTGSVLGVAAAYALVLAFRIRDDLADVDVDRRAHPTRITVVASDLSPLRAMMSGATIVGAALVALSPARIAGLIALTAITVVAIIWYSLRARIGRRPNAPVILLKYPVIAFIAATAGATTPAESSVAVRPIAGFAAIYLIACLYEVFHDRGLHT